MSRHVRVFFISYCKFHSFNHLVNQPNNVSFAFFSFLPVLLGNGKLHIIRSLGLAGTLLKTWSNPLAWKRSAKLVDTLIGFPMPTKWHFFLNSLFSYFIYLIFWSVYWWLLVNNTRTSVSHVTYVSSQWYVLNNFIILFQALSYVKFNVRKPNKQMW